MIYYYFMIDSYIRIVFLSKYLFPMVLLKTILILVLVYYFFKIVFRLFAPRLLNYAAKKTEAHFKENFRQFGGQQSPNNDAEIGKIVVDKESTSNRKSSNKVGEYIDFEEID